MGLIVNVGRILRLRWGLCETSKNTTTPRAPCGAKNWTLLGIVHHIVSKKNAAKTVQMSICGHFLVRHTSICNVELLIV